MTFSSVIQVNYEKHHNSLHTRSSGGSLMTSLKDYGQEQKKMVISTVIHKSRLLLITVTATLMALKL